MKIIQACTLIAAYDSKEEEKFYEDVKIAIKLYKTQYSFIIGDFNAKVEKKIFGMIPLDNFGIDS